jgi:NO-binding membrane sensor protein with MHYT domain
MRLWVPHEERRPQPEPLRTNDLLAFQVGLGLWLVGLAIVLGMLATPIAFDPARALITIGFGLVLGVAGLFVSRRQRS